MTDVAVLGAGPYGLAVAAALSGAGVEHRVIGEPMSFWKDMPEGMLLRSNWTATSIADYRGPVSLDAYVAATGAEFGKPVPLENFVAYGEWVQSQVAPEVDRRAVRTVTRVGDGFTLSFGDGSSLRAGRVVVAAGIAPFARRPAPFAGLPLATHASEHRDFSRFKGERVIVVGGGQSALESAALLHESGAEVEVLVRRDQLTWLHGGKYQRMLGRAKPLFYAPTDVGPLGLSRVVAAPSLFRRLPRSVQTPAARRAIRPAGAEWLISRLREVPIRLGFPVRSASVSADGKQIRVESAGGDVVTGSHLIYGTGYQVDITHYPFLAPELIRSVRRVEGYPVLGPGLESTVPGLHFAGAPAAWSFGPIMRFVSGGWFASRAVAGRIAGRRQ
ncbi:NAD(P)-binding domain-containing protein [Actinoplanes sp. NPDC026619]|uniref:NAD(P)-binding domain-containing protein n=1 Tax=Actinoplanes sp. NPDC026619 TaxID=3155798 RepID=UPI0033CB82C7